MVLTSIIIGYFVGKISISRKITPILDRLGILDTGNIFLWDDLMDKKYPMKICITCDDSKYEGIAHNIESYSNSPHIALSSYIIYDKDGKIIENHSKNNRRVIIIDTAASKKVEIIYDKDSDECKDIQLLCDYNKKI